MAAPYPSAVSLAFPLPPSSPSSRSVVPITLPPHSTFATGRHWHITHTEYLRVEHGAALITVHNTSKIYTPSDGIVTVPRRARHEWARWDCPGRKGHQLAAQEQFQERIRSEGKEAVLKEMEEEDLVVSEWTDPVDGEKEIFFRNLFSGIQETYWVERYGEWLGGGLLCVMQIFTTMMEGDTFVVFFDLGGVDGVEKASWGKWSKAKVEDAVMGLVMGTMVFIGRRVFGMKGVNEEYTPQWLLQKWQEKKGLKQA